MKKSDLKKLLAIGAAVTAAAAAGTAVVLIKRHRDAKLLEEKTKTLAMKNAYITGGGISALASALYLVRDCGMDAANVHVFTNGAPSSGSSKTGYICRRNKIINMKSSLNFFDLVNDVSSLDIPDLTVCDEILNIYRANPASRSITFIDENNDVIDISKIKISKAHRHALAELTGKHDKLDTAAICDVLPYDFFDSPFWKILSAAYGFSKESSARELTRCLEHMDGMLCGTIPADFDHYEEIIAPLTAHLKKLGVDIRESANVTDIDFKNGNTDAIHFTDGAVRKTFYLNDGDICIMPTDNMASGETLGSFNEPAPDFFVSSYDLWYNLSKKSPAFKDPSLFLGSIDSAKSEEFTITLSNRLLPELIDKVTCGALGNDGIIVLDNSAWKMTVCAVPSSHFKNMDENTVVLWGTAMEYGRDGEKCGKPMTFCSGAEILYELVCCLNLGEVWDDIRDTVINVIPCHRRYDRAYLAPVKSKLEIIPTGISNFAVSGDFAESDNDTVFSEEYAVTTARSAAYKLMKTNRKMFETRPSSLRDIKKSLKKLV